MSEARYEITTVGQRAVLQRLRAARDMVVARARADEQRAHATYAAGVEILLMGMGAGALEGLVVEEEEGAFVVRAQDDGPPVGLQTQASSHAPAGLGPPPS